MNGIDIIIRDYAQAGDDEPTVNTLANSMAFLTDSMDGRTLIDAASRAFTALIQAGDGADHMTFETALLAAGLQHQGDSLAPALIHALANGQTSDTHAIREAAQAVYDHTPKGGEIVDEARAVYRAEPLAGDPYEPRLASRILENLIQNAPFNASFWAICVQAANWHLQGKEQLARHTASLLYDDEGRTAPEYASLLDGYGLD